MKDRKYGKEKEAVANSTLNTLHATLNKLTIANWSEDDRPRERLERLGPQALSDAELLAILVGSGSTKEDAVSLMSCRRSSRIRSRTNTEMP